MSLSSFVISVASDHAKRGITDETGTLSSRDWKAFLSALDEPDKPRPRLEAAARRYRERRMSRDADEWRIVSLGRKHERSAFDCGEATLNHAYPVDPTPATLALRAKRMSCDFRNKLCQ